LVGNWKKEKRKGSRVNLNMPSQKIRVLHGAKGGQAERRREKRKKSSKSKTHFWGTEAVKDLRG